MTQTQDSPLSHPNSKDMSYHYLEASDIHEIRLNGGTRQTMQELFQRISQIYYATPASGVTRILIVQSADALPMNYFMGEVRTFISQHRRMPRPVPARFAVVLEKTPLLQLISQMLKLMRHQDRVVFFNQDEYEAACAWLIEP
jgi:hypothetical protein